MTKNLWIEGVTRYFEPHVNDCFQNALSALLLFHRQNPDLILADYLSFLYDREAGQVGINYPFKYNTSVEFSEEELNTSLALAYFPLPVPYGLGNTRKPAPGMEDRIHIRMYTEKDPEAAEERLMELLRQGIPAVTAVDLHYIPYHRAFGKDHGLHYVVITGYDVESDSYRLFDKYRLSSSDFDGSLTRQQIRLARNSENPQKNEVVGEYTRPLQNIWCEVDIPPSFGIMEEKIRGILEESCNRMEGRKRVLGRECGFRAMEALGSDLLAKADRGLGERDVPLFRNYFNETFKTIARSRKRFKLFLRTIGERLPGEDTASGGYSGVQDKLDEASRHWDIMANLSLKLGITRSVKLIEDIHSQLTAVMELEQAAVEGMSGILQRRGENEPAGTFSLAAFCGKLQEKP